MKTKQKTGGRVAGTPNRTTAETKELIQKLVGKELETITELLDKLDPKERIDVIIKLMNFVVPKQSYIELETEIKQKPVDLSLMTTAELIERAKSIE